MSGLEDVIGEEAAVRAAELAEEASQLVDGAEVTAEDIVEEAVLGVDRADVLPQSHYR